MALPETYIPGFHDENAVKKMKYNQFGRTDMTVSQLSLGTGGFSSLYGNFTLEGCRETLVTGLKSGLNYIDTAPFYGQGTSEEVLGKILKDVPRKSYYIATKLGRYTMDPKTMFDFSAKRVKESIETSLTKLGLDYVDVIQIHDIEFAPSLDVIINETLPAVEELVKSGKARFIGVTGYPVSVLKECISRSKVKIDMVLSYARETIADDTLSEYLPFFKSKHLGVVCAAVHALGLLSSAGPQPWHPAPEDQKVVYTEAREYCKKNGVELGRLALYHALQKQGYDTILIGNTSVKILQENLNVYYNGISSKEKEVYQEVVKILKKLPSKHWENTEVANYWKAVKAN